MLLKFFVWKWYICSIEKNEKRGREKNKIETIYIYIYIYIYIPNNSPELIQFIFFSANTYNNVYYSINLF